MAAGHPLNDDDRQPWLETLNQLMQGWFDAGKGGVLACSALKAKYRDTLCRRHARQCRTLRAAGWLRRADRGAAGGAQA